MWLSPDLGGSSDADQHRLLFKLIRPSTNPILNRLNQRVHLNCRLDLATLVENAKFERANRAPVADNSLSSALSSVPVAKLGNYFHIGKLPRRNRASREPETILLCLTCPTPSTLLQRTRQVLATMPRLMPGFLYCGCPLQPVDTSSPTFETRAGIVPDNLQPKIQGPLRGTAPLTTTPRLCLCQQAPCPSHPATRCLVCLIVIPWRQRFNVWVSRCHTCRPAELQAVCLASFSCYVVSMVHS